jgi:SWI/SNF related-matrix-associated actin-dependent regulator of chromatin subfamily C
VRRNIYESNGKAITPSDPKAIAANGEASTNGVAGAGKTLEESLKEDIPKIYCHVCGNDCTRVRFHNAKAPTKFDICPRCFRERKYSTGWERGDFTEMENKEYSIIPDRESHWTDDELLLLLEGLEMYDEEWSKIADHVGTRTREECVLKFLQLEIEDDFVEPSRDAQPHPALAMSYLGEGRAPFSQVYNPVLSTMAYLAGIADPSVTAAAVGKSVEAMQRSIKERIENGTAKSQKGKEKAADSGATEDAAPAEPANNNNNNSGDAMDVETGVVATTQKDKQTSASQQPLITLPFALTAARASALASHEERNLTRMIHTATNLQIEKLDVKLQQFSDLETMLKLERKDLERRRQSLFLERLEFQRRMKAVEDEFERAMALGPADGLKAIREVVRGATSKGSLAVGRTREADEVQPLGQNDPGFRQFSL